MNPPQSSKRTTPPGTRAQSLLQISYAARICETFEASPRFALGRASTENAAQTTTIMLPPRDVAAALHICKSLRLALIDAKVLPGTETMALLYNAAPANAATEGMPEEKALGKPVAALIHWIIDGGNSVRRRQ